jgi:hypothetical protein
MTIFAVTSINMTKKKRRYEETVYYPVVIAGDGG